MSRSTDTDVRNAVSDETHDTPGVEPWIKISLAAFVPLVLAFYLPNEWQPALFVAGGLLVVVSIVALIRQERNKRPGAST